jgi:hypothetical protein
MLCQICGNRTQQETVVRLRPGFGGMRAVKHEAWYCWVCGISHQVDPSASDTKSKHSGLTGRLHAAWRVLIMQSHTDFTTNYRSILQEQNFRAANFGRCSRPAAAARWGSGV